MICLQVSAQDDSSQVADVPEIPVDEFNRGTPLRSAEGFLAAADEADYESAAEYMDLRNLRGAARDLAGAELARRFDVIINRASWADIDDLIDDPAGRNNDNLPDYRDSIGIVVHQDKEVRLFMQKVPGPNGVFIWKISNATVSLIPELYDTFGYSEFIEDLRQRLPHVNFLGFELFKWVIVITVGMLVYGLLFLIVHLIRRMLRDPNTPSHRRLVRFLLLPFGIWMVTISMNVVATSLGRGLTAEAWQRVSPIPILITVWALFAGINLIRDIYSTHLNNKGRPGAVVLLNPASKAIKVLVAMSAVLVYLSQLGFDITTVLAGLGVGGIAVALALQKPMEDVFGAITLYTQQPVKVGDFCRIGTQTGTVEEIGLRATRIRTLSDTLIAIPNARLANEPIDNISSRGKTRYRSILRLRYDTTPEQLSQILVGIRGLLSSHEKVLPDNHRVRFTEIAADALLVEVYLYLATTVWAEYLELAEKLNIQILEIIAAAGTSLSLPARALHIEQSGAIK